MSLINTPLLPFSATYYQGGKFHDMTEADVAGKWAVFFFYPADFTFVCPTELEDLADHYDELKKMGVEVYGVSTDTHFAHKAWHDSSAAIGKVKYPLVGDPSHQLSKNFGVLGDDGLDMRGTFLVDPQGKIQVYEVHVAGVGRNAAELVRKVKAAQYIAKNPGQVCPAKWQEGDSTLTPGIDLVGKI